MCPLSNRPSPDSIRQAFIDSGNSGKDSDYELLKNLIFQANSVSILKLFKTYIINVDEFNKKTTCPFLSHSNGLERTPSFYYYPETNTFYCFGCKNAGGPVNFLSLLKNISKREAAIQILKSYSNGSSSVLEDIEVINFAERASIMMNFSESIREFILINGNNKSVKYAEKLCAIFDAINNKHNLDNEGLKFLILKLENLLGQYNKC